MRRLCWVVVGGMVVIGCRGEDAVVKDAPKGSASEKRNPVIQTEPTNKPGFLVQGKGFAATNEARGLRAILGEGGIEIRPTRAGDWSLRMNAERLGRGGSSKPIAVRNPEERTCVNCPSRIEYRHEGLLEWWEHKDEGFEQGFDVLRRPEGTGQLAIDVLITGLESRVELGGQSIALYQQGEKVLSYESLLAVDAHGKKLASRMEVHDSTIRILVEDREATYPVYIDPLLTSDFWQVESNQASAKLGQSVTWADMNGDGYADLLVGWPYWDNGQTDEGRVALYLSSSSGTGSTPAWTAETNVASSRLGASVSSADVNCDGRLDVIVGAPGFTNGAYTAEGRAYVFYGCGTTAASCVGGIATTPSWISSAINQSNASFGGAVSGADDINNDNCDDFVVGAIVFDNGGAIDAGRLYAYRGSTAGPVLSKYITGSAGQKLGSALAAGDVNGDGYGDVVASAPGSQKIYIYMGGSSGLLTTYDLAWDHGFTVCGSQCSLSVGDALSDVIIVGVPDFDSGGMTNNGAVKVFAAGDDSLNTTAVLYGEKSYAQLGAAVASGDVNGDDHLDLIGTAKGYSNGQSNEGAAYLYLGSSSGFIKSTIIETDQASAYGWQIAAAGDADNDGFDDVVLGSAFYDNGQIDEGIARVLKGYCTTMMFLDSDGDGFGGTSTCVEASTPSTGTYVATGGDLDDGNGAVYPGASEACDGADNDGDGQVDESGATGETSWYADTDSDGYGDLNAALMACIQPPGYIATTGDCDDSNAAANPSKSELCSTAFDDNCNGDVNEDASNDAPAWYADSDGDTFGSATTRRACSNPLGYVATTGDCDDGNAAANPGKSELCSTTFDDNCDGNVNEDTSNDAPTWYADADEDTFGGTSTKLACSQPAGYLATTGDCDDSNAAANPSKLELCSTAFDDNCNGQTSESTASDVKTWYVDNDLDGYGLATSTTKACTQPTRTSANYGDCDDTRSSVSPAKPELCSTSYDDNCNSQVNESTASDASTWYADVDNDGFGNAAVSQRACTQPSGHVGNAGDCNDSDQDINSAEDEVCDNGVDNNCDGYADGVDSIDAENWCADNDGDTHGDVNTLQVACAAPASSMINECTDCDDANAGMNPEVTGGCIGLWKDKPAWSAAPSTTTSYSRFGWAIAATQDGNGCVAVGDYYSTYQTSGTVYVYDEPVSGSEPEPQFTSTGLAGSSFGNALAFGDVNGDGWEDLLVGANFWNYSAGKAYLFLGASVGIDTTSDWEISGDQAYSYLGASVALADFNGDGLDDVVVAAREYASSESKEGRVYVFLGQLGSAPSTTASWTWESNSSYAKLGCSLANAGDTNGDGNQEIVIGACEYRPGIKNVGRAYVYSMGNDGSVSSIVLDSPQVTQDTYFGFSVASAGDVNGDHLADIIIGAKDDNGSGKAYLYLSSAAGLSVSPSWTGTGTMTKEYFGYAVSAADVDGDGFSDVMVGAPSYSGLGKTYVYRGSGLGLPASATWTLTARGTATSGEFGSAIANLGDSDGDGADEVAIGDYAANAVYVYRGSPVTSP